MLRGHRKCVGTDHGEYLRDFADISIRGSNSRMNDFADALYTAASLVGHFDPELHDIVLLSFGVSLTASVCAFLLGAPLGRPRGIAHGLPCGFRPCKSRK